MKKIIILTISSVLFSLSTFAQKAQNELVISGGIGYSLTTAFVKGVINSSLKEQNCLANNNRLTS